MFLWDFYSCTSNSAGVPSCESSAFLFKEVLMFARILFLAFTMFSVSAIAQTPFNHPCPDHTVPDRTVTICTPTQSAQVPGSFFIVGHITDSLSFTSTLLIDGVVAGGGAGVTYINVEAG